MPEINDVLEATTAAKTNQVVDATIVESTGKTDTPATESLATAATPAEAVPPVVKPEKKVKVVKKPKEPKAAKPEEKEDKLSRPPMEQIVRDFEEHIMDLEVAGKKLKKLGYKCGKIIFGLESTDGGKDFRVIAFKARKKTKSVAGKSRCIFYFGLSKDAKVKDLPGVKSTKFGQCSVQSEKPVELTLDKVTFTEIFTKDADKVMETLKKLAAIAVEHKTEAFAEKAAKQEEKTAAKKAKADAKPKKEAKTKKA
jgi:hypothetical protein